MKIPENSTDFEIELNNELLRIENTVNALGFFSLAQFVILGCYIFLRGF